jgi:hypothetical protein
MSRSTLSPLPDVSDSSAAAATTHAHTTRTLREREREEFVSAADATNV